MADPYLKRYHRERQKRINAILAARDLVRGGQGRTAGDLERDATGVVFALAGVVFVIVLLVLASCGGSP